MDIFSMRLKWLREKKGLTQKEVAEYMGVSQQYYGRFEKGQAQPNLEALVKLHPLFEEEIGFIIGAYNLDRHASKLLSIYREAKEAHDRNKGKVKEFLNLIQNEQLEDGELRRKIFDVVNSNERGITYEGEYLRAKEAFTTYLRSIPGVNDDLITDEYLNSLFEHRRSMTDEYTSLKISILYGERNTPVPKL